MRRLIFLGLFILLIPFALNAQNIRVSGTVVDEGNEPLPGVNVVQEGTTNGTITDIDGNYSLEVPSDAKISFSFIGFMNHTENVDGRTSISVAMKPDNQEIEEVVVVGYGTQKKSDLTGSVASVKGEDLMNRSTTDAAAALQGKAAGIQVLNSSGKPGQGAQIRVRGYSSNSEKIGPLLIVDGLPVSSIQYLDPSLIESMEVLKDAASAAIYGAEAGNGVVLITTKTGSKKNNGTITYDAKFTNQMLGRVPELLNASEFIDWMTMQKGADEVNGALSDAQSKYGWDPNTNTDWLDAYFENTWAQQHTVSFSGGNDRGSFFGSIGYVDQDGIVKGSKDKYERLTAQINADYKIKDWLKIGTNTSIEKWKSQGVSENGYGTSFEMLLLIDPLTPLYWTEESQMLDDYKPHYQAVQAGRENYTLFGDENGYYATSYFNPRLAGGNPFPQRDRAREKKDGVNVNGSAYVNITPIKQITYTSRLGYRIAYNNTSNYEFPYYLNGQTKGDNYMINGISQNSLWYQWENFINYNQTFAEKHNLGAMVGMSYRDEGTNEVNAKAEGADILKAYTDNYIYLNSVNGLDETKRTIGGVPNTLRSISYFGRLTYNFDNRYSVQTNFRADAFDASKLSEDNRWGKFFSASLGWTFSNESFFKDNIDESIMSFGKIRASWGQNGNVNVLSNYKYRTALEASGKMYNYGETNKGTFGSMQNGRGNPGLSWEKSEQIDLGADFRFLRDRLTMGLDWYKKTTKDLLVDAPTSPELGISSYTINAGKVENRGFEMELTWKDKIGDFNYSVSGNMATLHNEVTYLDPSIQRIKGGDVDGSNLFVACYFEENQPIWYMRGYKYAGRANDGSAQFYDKNGNLTNDPQSDDMTNIGSGLPTLTYGITFNAEYKGFDLTVFGTGAAGNDVYYGLYRTDYNNIAKGVYDDFKSGDFPDASKVAGGKFWSSSAMVYSGAFFKIKQIQLGYTLPSAIVKKAFMQNVRAYVSLDDFFTFTKYPGLDPETCTQGYNAPGLDRAAYPNMKKVVLGFSVTF